MAMRRLPAAAMLAPACLAYAGGEPQSFEVLWETSKGEALHLNGFKPEGAGPHPVFMVFGGNDDGYPTPLWSAVASQMAWRGFVAASVDYEGGWGLPTDEALCENHGRQAESIFRGGGSALEVLCAMPESDCSRGVAAAGYGQGGYLALLGAQKSSKVTAVLAMAVRSVYCMSMDSHVSTYLPRSKRRLLNAFDDYIVGGFVHIHENNVRTAQRIAGYDCQDDFDCLQGDGSGYYLVSHSDFRQAACEEGSISHSFFFSDGRTQDNSVNGDTLFLCDFLSDAPWALPASLDWLARAARSDGVQPPAAPLDYMGSDMRASMCLKACPPEDAGLAMTHAALGAASILTVLNCCCLCCIVSVCAYYCCIRPYRVQKSVHFGPQE